ncbi:hypothetical protein [Sphingobium boeckii]|uniref:Uncharacterized protein n=1 Tax=Sphingobium boeckii TaxID=1082345 RepID=A0A7W9EE42_9SPHN|nr:hypothetical protein [Sphingobium boeckii]MBB5684605.1 hypothetical protein [Sphingobium boeckii]
MTASNLLDLFITTLARNVGGDRRRWRAAVGDVRIYSMATHPHCNWSVTPSGSIAEMAAVERLADDLRGRHPIVERG